MGNCCESSTYRLNELSLNSSKSHISFVQDPPGLSSHYEASAALKSLQNYRVLMLKVLSSGGVGKGTSLFIEPVGLQGGLRRAEDGFTFFGSKKKQGGITVNDFVIPVSEDSEKDGKHFMIFYNIDKSSYWIKDLGRGWGVFARIEDPLHLRDNMLINVGESFIVLNIEEEQLCLKLFSGSIAGELSYSLVRTFNASDSKVTIGRSTQARLHLEDSLMSKIQCEIHWDQCWILTDGDKTHNKPSTNGTWLYLNEEFEIYDKMVFKTHQTLIQASVI